MVLGITFILCFIVIIDSISSNIVSALIAASNEELYVKH